MRNPLRLVCTGVAAVVLVAALGAGPAAAEILGAEELEVEMRANQALREYVRHSGFPDLAQRTVVDSSWPWQTSVVRLFYLHPRTEIGFSRAYLLGNPQLGLTRYVRPMDDAMAADVRRYIATAPPPDADADPVTRAEEAAGRAEVAAEMTELGAIAAERAAERLDELAARAETEFRTLLRK
jgi:hypothetical protein